MPRLSLAPLLASVVLFGCAATQSAPDVPKKPALSEPAYAPELIPTDERTAAVRIGTPSGLGMNTRRIDNSVDEPHVSNEEAPSSSLEVALERR